MENNTSKNTIQTNVIGCRFAKCSVVKVLKSNNEQLLAEVARLQEENKIKDAVIQELKHELLALKRESFGQSSEKAKYRFGEGGEFEGNKNESNCAECENDTHQTQECQETQEYNDNKNEEKKRGAKLGHKGHGRYVPMDIETVVVEHELSGDEITCKECGKVYRKTAFEEISSEIDIEIKIIKRVHKRAIYKKSCLCIDTDKAEMIVAPKPAQIIPKSLFSNKMWIYLMVMKYFFQIPLNKTLSFLGMNGYEPLSSTVIGGFKKINEYLQVLYEKLLEVSKQEEYWHADETRWLVFEERPDKQTYNWWLWTFVSDKVIAFVLDSSRSGKVPNEYFKETTGGTINTDRYSAYNILNDKMRRAFCWYHLRRDFIRIQEGSKQLSGWALNWIVHISKIESINTNRIISLEDDKEYAKYQLELEKEINIFFDNCDKQLLKEDELTKKQKTVLKSMQKNKQGYITFVLDYRVPMHNNIAENALRSGAVGRKNYYGSHSHWSGEMASYCMTIFQTVNKHKLNVFAYLEYYIDYCAKTGQPPENKELDKFLPWNIDEETIQKYNMRKRSRNPHKNKS